VRTIRRASTASRSSTAPPWQAPGPGAPAPPAGAQVKYSCCAVGRRSASSVANHALTWAIVDAG
jgi:hypothetical protein